MAVDGIIFDFDGVIIDTETPDYDLWREFYDSHSLALDVDLWMKRVGVETATGFQPAEYFEKLTGKTLDAAFLKDHFNHYVERCALQPILPGVEEMIEQASAKGIKLSVASNSPHEWVERWLRQHDLMRYFDCVRTREDVKKPKPAPDVFLSAAECMKVPPERCVVIEDSPSGMQGAIAAGIRCVAVPNPLTIRLPRPEVTLTVNSLADFGLTDLLARF